MKSRSVRFGIFFGGEGVTRYEEGRRTRRKPFSHGFSSFVNVRRILQQNNLENIGQPVGQQHIKNAFSVRSASRLSSDYFRFT
jgi:hypothetical protein